MSYQEHTVALDDVSIHYLEWGETGQTPVLLLHGYLDIAHGWVPFVDCGLSWGRVSRCCTELSGAWEIRMDGGYSYTFYNYIYDIVQLLEHLGWERFYLIGHSMGANCASVLAGTYPDRIVKLALLEGFGIPGYSADDAPEKLAYHIERRLPATRKENKIFDTFDDVVTRIQTSNPGYALEHAQMLAREGAKELDDGRWTWRFDARMRWPNPVMYLEEQFHAFWKRITAPTIQVIGEDSSFAIFAEADHWNIPNMRMVTIEKSGHMIQHDAPETLSQCIREFFETTKQVD